MSRQRLLLFVCLLACKTASSQFSDSLHYHVGFISTGSYNRTNTSSAYLLNDILSFNVKQNKMSYNFVSKWLYGAQNNKLTNNDYTSTFDVNLYKTFRHFNYWGLFNYTSSYSLKIYNQLQTGLGIAYTIIDKKNAGLNLSYGVIYDYSDIILKDGNHDQYRTLRNSMRLKFKWNIGTRFIFSGNGFYQPSLQYGHDYIIKSDMSLALKIKKWLSVTAGFTYNEMSRTGAQNVFMNYGLVIDRYF